MSVGLQRASTFAIAEESTAGTYAPPASGANFVPLRPGNELSFEPEQLENDELINDIGAAKSATGKEVVSGSHSAYLKHSGVEGVEPEVGVLYESILGSKRIIATEVLTAAGSGKNIVKVETGKGVDFRVGQAVLVKSGTGFEMRNVSKIAGDDITMNFKLDNAPIAAIGLGKAVTYSPTADGHPTFSTTKYIGGSFAKEISAGNTVTEASITMDANGYAEVEFSFEGTKYFFNPITVTSANKFLDVIDDSGTYAIELRETIYKTPIELALSLEAALNASSTEDYTVKFSSVDGKFTIASTGATLSLLWLSGTNTTITIGSNLGFSVAADSTGSMTYTSNTSQSYSPAFTPTYDDASSIIVKDADLFIGNVDDNICICAQTVSITISKEVEDVDCICEESGILEKIPTGRSVEMSVTAVLKKHDVVLLDALLKNTTVSAMINAGPKTGGNWVAGKCFNAYLQSCTVSKYTTTGDSFVQASISLKGFVSSDTKDIFLNFV